jgi:adhesin transport system outer membrane protein
VLAATTHPSIVAKRSSQQAAKADVESASWQRYPTPSLEAATVQNQRPSTALKVQQPLWAGGRITAGIDAAEAREKAAGSGVGEARQDILRKIIAAFSEAQRQQLRQEFSVKAVKEHEKLLSLIARRVESQVSPQVDQNFAQSRLIQTMNELSMVTQSLSNAMNQLSQLAGQSVSRVTPVSTTIPNLPASKVAALELALQHSPELARMGFEEEAAGADIASKRAAYMPQISARYERVFGAASSDRVMLVLESQPGAGLSAASGVDAAIAKREAIRHGRETLVRDLTERLTTDWNELVASRLRLENAVQGRSMSTEVFDSYARQFTTGKKSWIDVLNAVRESTQSEMAVADAEGQLIASALRLKLLTATLD